MPDSEREAARSVALGSEAFDRVADAIADIRAGRMVIVVDSPDRENEGDLIMAAEHATEADINFMAQWGRGLICVPLPEERADALDLPAMVAVSADSMQTAFTVSTDAAQGITTGISAADRARTVRILADPASRPQDLVRPGHIFPLRAKPGGVLRRRGHTEAAVDLARLAGLQPVGVICEIMNPDGTMARTPELFAMARRFGLRIVTIEDLVQYRLRHESLYRVVSETRLPTRYGVFRALACEEEWSDTTHLALVMGDVASGEPVLVRLHSECLTGDVFGSLRCDCGNQLDLALRRIAEEGRGVLIYLRQEGRGIGLANKIRAYRLQEEGYDTVSANLALGLPADARDYTVGAQILRDLGVRRLRLLTNNPDKYRALEQFGLEIVERLPIVTQPVPENAHYLTVKKEKLGHWLE